MSRKDNEITEEFETELEKEAMENKPIDTIEDEQETIDGGNLISFFLNMAGWIVIIGGIIAGFNIGQGMYGLNYTIAIYYWVAGLISGLLLISFGEVIKLLHEINLKIK